ncbi:unnamed protein product [Blepharisma stoltei]|uniref:Uncharacterized protein n=1 Tax=Blepharisma stoltei TaxID=1481888 RepID=A0AAU9IY36_9CILI|nr:unnamed protein product [Blepharisma stoltei]
MLTIGSRLFVLVKRYLIIKILKKEPPPLGFDPDYNPLLIQDLFVDDPCTIPFKVTTDGNRVFDGNYSIEVRFIEDHKFRTPTLINVFHWDLEIKYQKLILIVKTAHILNPMRFNWNTDDIHTNPEIYNILENVNSAKYRAGIMPMPQNLCQTVSSSKENKQKFKEVKHYEIIDCENDNEHPQMLIETILYENKENLCSTELNARMSGDMIPLQDTLESHSNTKSNAQIIEQFPMWAINYLKYKYNVR